MCVNELLVEVLLTFYGPNKFLFLEGTIEERIRARIVEVAFSVLVAPWFNNWFHYSVHIILFLELASLVAVVLKQDLLIFEPYLLNSFLVLQSDRWKYLLVDHFEFATTFPP